VNDVTTQLSSFDDVGTALQGRSVCIVSFFYTPDFTGIAPYAAELSASLASAGVSVRVITGVPHYPAWKVDARYRFGFRWVEQDGSVRVSRYRHWVPRQPKVLGRALLELSFLLATVVPVALDDSEAIIVITPTLSGLAAAVLGRRRRPVGVIVQDLVGSGAEQSGSAGGRLSRAIASMEYRMMRKAKVVGVITEAFGNVLRKEHVEEARLMDVANFTRVERSTASKAEARQELGWPSDEFLVVHTGNMGMKQGLDVVERAASLATRSGDDVVFALVGDGNQRKSLEAEARDLKNLRFVDPVSDAQYPLVLAAADVLLLCERPGVKDMSMPSKLTSYLSASRPMVASVESEGATGRLVEALGVGAMCEPGDAESLLSTVRLLRGDSETQLELVMNSERALRERYGRTAGWSRYRRLFARLCDADLQAPGHFYSYPDRMSGNA